MRQLFVVESSAKLPSLLPVRRLDLAQNPSLSLRRLFFTVQDLKDPERLYQVIYQLTQGVQQAIRQIAEMLEAGRVPPEERRRRYHELLLEQSERLVSAFEAGKDAMKDGPTSSLHN